MILVRGVHRLFREGSTRRPVLRGVDLEVGSGECLALLGRSGSGKSSLLNLIAGIDLPDRGQVWIDGTELTALSERRRTLFRRRHIGFVYQFFNLIPTLSVRENVLLPLDLNGERRGSRVDHALELVAELGLGGRLDSYPDRLSEGEQQRVALARALAHEPDLVLADEPTGNLDTATGAQVLQLLDQLVRRRGHTLFVVTHSEEVARLADRHLRLEDGRIVDP